MYQFFEESKERKMKLIDFIPLCSMREKKCSRIAREIITTKIEKTIYNTVDVERNAHTQENQLKKNLLLNHC